MSTLPTSLNKTASWVIVNRATGAAVFETFNENTAKAVNEKLYRAMPAIEYLRQINKALTSAQDSLTVN